jgi:hypothetical protein
VARSFDPDKRRYIRYEVLDYAQAHLSSTFEPFNVVIVDIGLGGLQLRSRETLPVGSKCKLHVGNEDKPPLVLVGEVRHSMRVPNSDLVASGVRFLPKTHEERLTIAEYVHAVFQRQCDLLAM